MKKEQDKWAESLRNRMKDYSESLSEGLWERIEHDLPASRVLPFWGHVVSRWQQPLLS